MKQLGKFFGLQLKKKIKKEHLKWIFNTDLSGIAAGASDLIIAMDQPQSSSFFLFRNFVWDLSAGESSQAKCLQHLQVAGEWGKWAAAWTGWSLKGMGSQQLPVLIPLHPVSRRKVKRNSQCSFNLWPLLTLPEKVTQMAEPKGLSKKKIEIYIHIYRYRDIYVALNTDTSFPLYLAFQNRSIVGAAVWAATDFTVQVKLWKVLPPQCSVYGWFTELFCSLLRLISLFPVQTKTQACLPRWQLRGEANLATDSQLVFFLGFERFRLNFPRQKLALWNTSWKGIGIILEMYFPFFF